MSNNAKGLFAFLATFSLLAVILGFEGIARLERVHAPPFNQEMFMIIGGVPMPPARMILFLNSICGRILTWLGVIAVPLACVLLAVRREKIYTAAAILFLWAGLCGWMGGTIWLNARLFFQEWP
jgi:hypothetical protein